MILLSLSHQLCRSWRAQKRTRLLLFFLSRPPPASVARASHEEGYFYQDPQQEKGSEFILRRPDPCMYSRYMVAAPPNTRQG
ncbi:hypothetical protein KSP40_PGU000391 [Platanthera guangdongensis]|uniref:Uncharacterized protein n=1 Tax=Platanthera guangdongensis TaxID=2320717 RepID=A0ABR2LN76_9ASPA